MSVWWNEGKWNRRSFSVFLYLRASPDRCVFLPSRSSASRRSTSRTSCNDVRKIRRRKTICPSLTDKDDKQETMLKENKVKRLYKLRLRPVLFLFGSYRHMWIFKVIEGYLSAFSHIQQDMGETSSFNYLHFCLTDSKNYFLCVYHID